MICGKCGHENVDDARYCYECGAPLKNTKHGTSDASSSAQGAEGSLGNYELIGEIGRGAMARVWRGWDPNLQREVAIKEPLFDPRLPQNVLDEMGKRFVAEGIMAARLNHPNIVTIYAADIYDGRPAIVMELVNGVTLAELLANGPLSSQMAMEVLDQLLDAVSYAHSQGVVHRDIKPDNIFINSDGLVKLADFGIARADNTVMTHATMAGAVLGTPGYMSPEQATGKTVDSRSDLFSIGIVAYQMLAGYNPFGVGENTDATTLLYRIVHEPVPELSSGAGEELPDSMRGAIMAALAKEPEDRPQSATEFKAMLHGNASVSASRGASTSLSSAVNQQTSRSGAPKWLPYFIVGVVGVVVIAIVLINAMNTSGGGGTVASSVAASASEVSSAAESAGEASTPSKKEAESSSSAVSAPAQTQEPKETKPEGQYPPVFTGADATSEQSAEGYSSASYSPYNTLDGDFATAWLEAGYDAGIGEWVRVYADTPQLVSGVSIVAGFPKTVDIYYANYRPQSVTVELSDGYVKTASLEDMYAEWQDIRFDKQHATTYIRITINSAYDTNHWPDDAIAEIKAF